MTYEFPSQLDVAKAKCSELDAELKNEKIRSDMMRREGRDLYWEARRMRTWATAGWCLLLLTWIGIVWCAWLGPALLGK